MNGFTKSRRSSWGLAPVLLWTVLLCGGCTSNTLSEAEVLSQLAAAGLTVERLEETLITGNQRDRLEVKPEQMFSVRVSDAAGHSQSMTLVEFDKEWKAASARDAGIPGFVVRNWLFVGVVGGEIRAQVEQAML